MVRYEAVEEENVPSTAHSKLQDKKYKIRLNRDSSVPQVEVVLFVMLVGSKYL